MTKLSDAARALGDQPAFPVMWEYAKNETGMTYRQWLIGQALAGNIRGATLLEQTAYGAVCVADAILNALASEQPEQPSRDLRTVAGGGTLVCAHCGAPQNGPCPRILKDWNAEPPCGAGRDEN